MEAAEIKKILENCKTIAVVGCSSNPEKAANQIPKYVKNHNLQN